MPRHKNTTRGMAYLSALLLFVCCCSGRSFLVDGFRFGTGSTGRKRESSILVCNAKDREPKGSRSDSEGSRTKTAVIVGAGPAGLAAALVLSNISKNNNISNNKNTSESQNLFERVIVLEDAPKESYDPSRAYFYNINKRGQRFTDAFDIDLTKRGLEVTGFAKLVVPSDPAEAFDETKVVRQQLSEEERKRVGTMYWIPRHELVEEIVEEIQAKNKKKGGTHTQIELRRGVRCKHVEPTKDGMVRIVTVTATATTTATESSGDDDQEDCLVADLCVGADGLSSGVRQSLEDGRFDPEHWSNAQNPSKKFGLKKYTTPSTGLRIKGLRIRPNFAIPKGGTGPDARTKIPLEARYNYGLRSATTGPTDSMNLIFLPQKDPDSKGGRSVNICTLPDHDIWDERKLRTDDGGRSAKAYFEKAFPRFDWNEIVAGDEWELFASTEGSRFPQCQYSPSLHVASKQPCPEDGDACNHCGIGAGVVLIGDALHSFPPDLGQGVNSAFCDAMVLGKCFEDAAAAAAAAAATTSVVKETTAESKIAKPSLIAEALQAYETRNGPETRALIALARCGAPYQYDQASFRMRLGKKLWTANVVLRLLLNKVTGGLSPKPAILMMMDSRSSFRRIMRRANTLTAILWSSVVVFAVALARLRLRLRLSV